MSDYIKNREDLKSDIRKNSNLDNCSSILFVFAACLKVGPEEVMGCIINYLQGGEDSGESLVSKIQEKIAREEFVSEYNLIEGDKLLRDFDVYESTVYTQIKWLIALCQSNKQSVEDNYKELKRRKRQSDNNDAWNKTIKDFAGNNFTLGRITQELMDTMPLEIRIHMAEAGLNDIPGRFVVAAFTLLESKKSTDDSNESFEGDGYEYEHHIASIISKYLPDANVEVTKASGDQGADIIVVIDRNKIVVQTKLYSSAVGNDAVQQAYAAKRYYTATAAVVVTNATFTKSANELAESLQVVLLHEDDVGPMFARAFS